MPRRFFHTLCVLLLLVAQQGALFHATWHASRDVQATQAAHGYYVDDRDTGPSPNGRSSQGGLCAFDLAFGQVLGGVHGSCAPLVSADLPAGITAYPFNPRLDSEAVPAQSRGPPVLL